MSRTQKAALLFEKHGRIKVGTRPIPSPGPKEMLVKITAAAINPMDWMLIEYGLEYGHVAEDYPIPLGTDGAGVVEAVGSNVTGFQKGDRVFFQGRFTPNQTTFQQYAIADSEIIAKASDNLSDDEASTIPVGSIPSVLGFFHKTGIPFPFNGPTASGKSVLIIGGSSSVGQYAIQLAHIAGFSPIVTTASERHVSYLRSLGATHVLERNASAKTIQSTFTRPVSVVFDAISSAETQPVAFKVLTTPSPVPGARLTLVLETLADLKAKNKALGNKAITINEVWGDSHLYRDITVPFWRTLEGWVKSGKFRPNRVQVVPGGLSGVAKGLELSKRGVSGVKLVVHPQE